MVLSLLLDGSMLHEVDGFSRARVYMSHPAAGGDDGKTHPDEAEALKTGRDG